MLVSSGEELVGDQYRLSTSIGPLCFIEQGRMFGMIFWDAGLGLIASILIDLKGTSIGRGVLDRLTCARGGARWKLRANNLTELSARRPKGQRLIQTVRCM